MAMFRKMRRFGQQVSEEECITVLKSEKRGALSVIGEDGYPYTVPVDFYYDETEGKLYFHGAKVGHKIDAIRACNKVCFTVWNDGFKKENDWAWNVTSVIVFGKAELVEEGAVVEEKVRKLALKYYPTKEEVEEEIERSLSRVQMISVTIEHMTGKLVHEK